jgi:flavin-dependent dehydrogenase
MKARPASPEFHCEICVLGGGPAGALAAHQLAELGHDTVLVDRVHSGRVRAESLAPSILPLLESVGLRQRIAVAVFRQETSALLSWEHDAVQEKRFDAGPSLLIERGRFDRLLREAAVGAGARLLAPATARSPERVPNDGWRIPVVAGSGASLVTARFLVDARGRRPGQAKRGTPLAAMSASWECGEPRFTQTRIEAGRDAWFWGSPLPDGGYAATIFVDPRRIAALCETGRAALYCELLARTKLLGELPSGNMTGPVRVRDATSGISRELIGNDFIRVGEAAVAIDPLASQGVQRAMVSAIQGAAAVHTLMTPEQDGEAAIEFYHERQHRAATIARSYAARLYALGGGDHANSFWTSRRPAENQASPPPPREVSGGAALPPRLRPAPDLDMIKTPVLFDSLVRRAPALRHPALAEPVAFIGGIALVPLIADAHTAATTEQIITRWSQRMSRDKAWEVARWMRVVGILVEQHSAGT